MDLNLFRVFDTVFRTGSLTLAGAQLHLSQPAVSNALARLRIHFDDPLFVREGRRMVPTGRARAIAPHVRSALHSLAGTLRQEPSRHDPASDERRYTIAMGASTEVIWLPPIHERIRSLAPRVRVMIARLERKTLAKALATGKLDLAIDIAMPLAKDIARRPLREEKLCIALRRDHPRGRRTLSLNDWLALDHVVASARSTGPVAEDLALQAEGLERRIALRCQSLDTACRIVANSDLAVTLPRQYAQRIATAMGLRMHEPPLPLAPWHLMLYWHQSTEDDPGLRWLREQCVAVAGGKVSR
jgi:DNA-binding transcriptional LysR family regulator